MEINPLGSWSHSLSDYCQMFDLTPDDLALTILDCAAGLSSFNSEMNVAKKQVVSCDPLYGLSPEQLTHQVKQLQENLLARVNSHTQQFDWGVIANSSVLRQRQQANAGQFLLDFPRGQAEGRYVEAKLPQLPFADYQFDLALCVHILFDGAARPSLDFIFNSLVELCRVAREVRVFPLLNAEGGIAPQLGEVIARLQMLDYGVEIRQVHYNFLKQGKAMLRIWPNQCQLA